MLLNENALKIMAEFCSDYSKEIYGRALANKLKMNQKTASNILNKLESEGILKYSTEGKNKYYFLNMLNPQLKDMIKIVEISRKNRFIEKHSKIKELFYKLEERAKGTIVIFGSYANFTNKEDSDLDVFVIGNISNIEDLEKTYDLKINIIKSSREKFNKNEVFIQEVIKNHIIIKGFEEFIQLIWE